MASETVDPIDWSHPPPYTGQYPLSSTYCTLQCGLQTTRLAALSQPRTWDFRMPDQRTAGAATQGISSIQYGHVKWGTHARVFTQTLAQRNNKIEKWRRNSRKRQAEKREHRWEAKWTRKQISSDSLSAARSYTVTPGLPPPEAGSGWII